MTQDMLIDHVSRAKSRWLKRVMHSSAPSTQKVLAYLIYDLLNCVTLDSWPAQNTLTGLLRRKSLKTAQRVARGLAKRGFITVYRSTKTSVIRYAPVFVRSDWDNNGSSRGHSCPEITDMNVHQSSLEIQLESSLAQPGKPTSRQSYKAATRGTLEVKLAAMLGQNGMDTLGRLASINDAIVDRLCRALAAGQIGRRELMAARLAADQARTR